MWLQQESESANCDAGEGGAETRQGAHGQAGGGGQEERHPGGHRAHHEDEEAPLPQLPHPGGHRPGESTSTC